MGTRGWFVFLYKGVYYRFYNHMDSYFTGLGVHLIKTLGSGDGNEIFDAIQKYLDLGIISNDGERIMPPSTENPGLVADWKAAETLVKTLSSHSGEMELRNHEENFLFGDGLEIDFIYVIDLDRDQFLAANERDQSVYCYPFEVLHPVVMEYAEGKQLCVGSWFQQSFPIPKVELDRMQGAFKEGGYQLETPEPKNLGLDACLFKASNIESGEKAFIKVFYSQDRKQGRCLGYKRPMAVARMLLECPHPNIVRIIKTHCNYELPTLVLEAYDGDLSKVLSDLKLDVYQEARVVCHALSDVARGLIFLHGKGIVHHDIKPENILVRVGGDNPKSIHAAICDFESIGIPFPSQKVDLSWGPFAEKNATSSYRARSRRDSRYLEGWENGKWTEQYVPPNRESVDPWSLDAYSLSVVANMYLGTYLGTFSETKYRKHYCSSESMDDDVSKKNLGKLHEEVMNILRDDSGASQEDICKNLDKVSKLLRSYDSVVLMESKKRQRQSGPDETEE